MPEFVDQIERNPYNLPGIDGAPQLSPHEYQRARFMRRGYLSGTQASNPEIPGTAAWQWWNDGRESRA